MFGPALLLFQTGQESKQDNTESSDLCPLWGVENFRILHKFSDKFQSGKEILSSFAWGNFNGWAGWILYGEEAGKAASEGLDAAGHAIGTAWTVIKIQKAMNPKSAFKTSTLTKSAAKAKADEVRAAKKK